MCFKHHQKPGKGFQGRAQAHKLISKCKHDISSQNPIYPLNNSNIFFSLLFPGITKERGCDFFPLLGAQTSHLTKNTPKPPSELEMVSLLRQGTPPKTPHGLQNINNPPMKTLTRYLRRCSISPFTRLFFPGRPTTQEVYSPPPPFPSRLRPRPPGHLASGFQPHGPD